MKYSVKGKVIAVSAVGDNWTRLEIEAREIAASALPGQFVQVRAGAGYSPLLRRPFSVAGAGDGGSIILLIKTVGEGTRIITSRAAGDHLDVTGPLGSSFRKPAEREKLFLVAGGVGVAPMRFFLEKYPDADARLFFGARTEAETIVLNDVLFEKSNVTLATEDGTVGEKGLVTDALAREMKAGLPDRVLCCGPAPMMKAVAAIAERAGVECDVSMETYMSCGIGACMGCVVPAAGDSATYLHACTDGPVMDAKLVDWDKI